MSRPPRWSSRKVPSSRGTSEWRPAPATTPEQDPTADVRTMPVLAVALHPNLQSSRVQYPQGVLHVVVSEGMELIIVLLVILANLVGLVWLQKWSGLT